MRWARLLFGVMLILDGSCRKESPSVVEPEMASGDGFGFQDFAFALVARSRDASAEALDAFARQKGHRVGMRIRLGERWTPGHIGNVDLVSYSGVVTICSLGAESDELLRQVDEVYGTSLAPRTMAAESRFAALSLKGNPSDLDAGPVKMKLFFESKDQERYAEIFLNIDVAASRLELAEKDLDYRRPVVRALMGTER